MITDVASLSKEERVEYDRAMKELRDTELVIESTRQDAYDDGFGKGYGKGVDKGVDMGRSKEKLANAKRMKLKGYPLEDIQDITGLSIEEIEKL
jgi:predicted transposase/invertase (TIGR01784 family)